MGRVKCFQSQEQRGHKGFGVRGSSEEVGIWGLSVSRFYARLQPPNPIISIRSSWRGVSVTIVILPHDLGNCTVLISDEFESETV
jgi:hypothetical protein